MMSLLVKNVNTIMMEHNRSIETKQSRIRLMEQHLNSYGDKLLFLQPDYHSQQVVISKECLHTQKCFPGTPGFSGVHSERRCIHSRRIGTQMYIEDATLFSWPIKSLVLREK